MTVFIEHLILVSVIFLMLGVGMKTPFGQILAATHLASVTREQTQQETTLIEDTFTRAPGNR
jgi:hypothetical protein